MEKVNCDQCGGDDSRFYLAQRDRFTGKEFNLVQCTFCSHIYLSPRPTQDELYKFYPAEYEAYKTNLEKDNPLENWHIKRALQLQLDFVEMHSQHKGKLLDVGCATGNFLNTAQTNGWQVEGVEPNESATRYAREKYGLNIHNASVQNVSLPLNSYDVVTLWDVLEHLPSPKKSLLRIHDLLKKNGKLIFSIPNLSSFDRYIFKTKWIGWDAPRHFNLYTESEIMVLLNETGFNFLQRKCILGGKGTFLLSLENTLKPHWRSKYIDLYPLISAILWPYRQFSYLLNKGPIITYAASKN